MRWLSPMVLALSGCSFLLQFDPETQPCDPAGLCGPSYFCSDAGLCQYDDGGQRFGDAGAPDASSCTAREEACGDGRDDDCDGQTDCADSDCNGVTCDDRDPCTTAEVCATGVCARGAAVQCNTPSPCQSGPGTCEAGTGRCLYGALADGTVCGAGQAARCCTGTCVNTTLNTTHCGGCRLACSTGEVCQPLDMSGCSPLEPANTSGRCTCSSNVPCPDGQICSNGTCKPTGAADCAAGQSVRLSADGGSCGTFCSY